MKLISAFFKFVVFLLSIFSLHGAYGNIFQVRSLRELEKDLVKVDDSTLIVFDVDEVLITTEDHAFHQYANEALGKYVQKLSGMSTSTQKQEELEKVMSLALISPKRVLIEEHAPAFIRDLQQKGAKAIALTSFPTGKFGLIPSVESWRVEHLQSFDIDFSEAFPEVRYDTFTDMASKGKKAPVYKNGVLFSKGYTKGEVLSTFFKKNNFYPKKVIFIDDLRENLESVKEELHKLGIEFVGVQYLGADPYFKEVNEQILHYQFTHLLQNKEWLSDAEVSQKLTKF
jgi:FMN phosphatase YigB (HAD superfamily)